MILVISTKNLYATRRLKYEAQKMNYEVEALDVEDLAANKFKVDINSYSALYVRSPYLKSSPKYIPQIVKLAKKFKKAGKKVVDSNIANGDLGKGKWKDYQALKKAGVLIPETNLLHEIARSAFALQEPPRSNLANYLKQVFNETATPGEVNALTGSRFPYVIKWIFGMKAKGTFLIRASSDLKKIPSYISPTELMQQEYIEADYEYKVVTVGYKALPVVLRFDFNKKFGRVEFGNYAVITSPDVTEKLSDVGARNPLNTDYQKAAVFKSLRDSSADLKKLERPLNDIRQVIKLAEKASGVLGRELAKIDILQKGNKFYVLEVNRFPGLKSFEELTDCNIFTEFVKYLI